MTYGYPDPVDEPQANVSQREHDQLRRERDELRKTIDALDGIRARRDKAVSKLQELEAEKIQAERERDEAVAALEDWVRGDGTKGRQLIKRLDGGEGA